MEILSEVVADNNNFGCVDCPASSAYRSERVKEPEEAVLRIGDSCNMHFSRCQNFFSLPANPFGHPAMHGPTLGAP